MEEPTRRGKLPPAKLRFTSLNGDGPLLTCLSRGPDGQLWTTLSELHKNFTNTASHRGLPLSIDDLNGLYGQLSRIDLFS